MAKITGFPLLPVMYRFSPTDNELVRDYLMIKSAGMPIPTLRGLQDICWKFRPRLIELTSFKPKLLIRLIMNNPWLNE